MPDWYPCSGSRNNMQPCHATETGNELWSCGSSGEDMALIHIT